MNYTTIKYEIAAGILTITLNRPEKMNAFTVAMCDELVDAFERASADDAVRAIVVTGAGKAFCAGMDLSVDGNVFGLDESLQPTLEDMDERLYDAEIERGVRDTGGRVTLAIYNCTKPTIAAINGVAVGIGTTMTWRWIFVSPRKPRAWVLCSAKSASCPKRVRLGFCRVWSACSRRLNGCTAARFSMRRKVCAPVY